VFYNTHCFVSDLSDNEKEKTMSQHEKEQKIVDTHLSKEPAIGQWLWALQDARARTLRELEDLSPAIIDWQTPDGESSIGTILYHIAGIEADWLYVEVLEKPFPPEVVALFPLDIRDKQGHLTQILGDSLEEHLSRLESVRALLLPVFQQMDLAEFRRVRSLEYYDVTPEWVLHHLMQHEAEHRSQIAALRARAERGSLVG
jgi:uncharacterized damage-inducible protein DinB